MTSVSLFFCAYSSAFSIAISKSSVCLMTFCVLFACPAQSICEPSTSRKKGFFVLSFCGASSRLIAVSVICGSEGSGEKVVRPLSFVLNSPRTYGPFAFASSSRLLTIW